MFTIKEYGVSSTPTVCPVVYGYTRFPEGSLSRIFVNEKTVVDFDYHGKHNTISFIQGEKPIVWNRRMLEFKYAQS